MSHWVNFEAWKIFPKSYSNPAACVNNHQLKADDLNKCLDKPVWTSSRYRTNRQCRRWSDERSIMKCLLEQCSCWEESTPTLDQLTASGSLSSSTAQREIKDERRNKNNSQIQKKIPTRLSHLDMWMTDCRWTWKIRKWRNSYLYGVIGDENDNFLEEIRYFLLTRSTNKGILTDTNNDVVNLAQIKWDSSHSLFLKIC